ncbi:MAG: hypothetical protein IKE52_05970 [Mogibacterium sp.]|nr:hypothetical protein [Mogibacterium sp.]
MIRGSTPTNRFKSKVDIRNASEAYMTYAQGDNILFEKTLRDFNITETTVLAHGKKLLMYIIEIELTQEDTLSFSENKQVEIQLKCKIDNKVLISKVLKAPVEKVLKEDVI